MSKLSLQSSPVEHEILPEGLSGGIYDLYFLSVHLQAPEHLPKTDTVVPTYYGQCRSCVVRRWRMGCGTRRDAVWSSGPEWKDNCCHLWSAAHHRILIIDKGWIREPPSFIFPSHSSSSFASSIQCPPCSTSSSVIITACSVGESGARRHHQFTLISSHSLLRTFISFLSIFLCPIFHSAVSQPFMTACPSWRTFPPPCHTVLIC